MFIPPVVPVIGDAVVGTEVPRVGIALELATLDEVTELDAMLDDATELETTLEEVTDEAITELDATLDTTELTVDELELTGAVTTPSRLTSLSLIAFSVISSSAVFEPVVEELNFISTVQFSNSPKTFGKVVPQVPPVIVKSVALAPLTTILEMLKSLTD